MTSLLIGGRLQRARQQSTRGSVGYILHFRKIHVEPRTFVAKCLPANNFSPLASQLIDRVQIFLGQGPLRHSTFLLELASNTLGDFDPTSYPKQSAMQSRSCTREDGGIDGRLEGIELADLQEPLALQ